MDRTQQLILGLLASKGLASSQELQDATGKSQATVSRALAELAAQVVLLGKARSTRYGLPKSIRGLPSQNPIYWTDETGNSLRIGSLSFLASDILFVDTEYTNSVSAGAFPWYLSPLRAEGFLGRLLGQRLAGMGLERNPEQWNLESILYAALQLQDAPGAISLGERDHSPAHRPLPTSGEQLGQALDEIANDVAGTLPAGSSAGGEQPKFLALLDTGHHVLVKFTPPSGTPFGDRWRDLLIAENLASATLVEAGMSVARSHVVESRHRTYLVSERFDRIGTGGRRHAVSVGAVHSAFVADSYAHWGKTCDALASRGQLPKADAQRANTLLHFGRLIGNTDMHAGNLALFSTLKGLAKGAFSLAPVYDMLPMRWRPSVERTQGRSASPAYDPFVPSEASLASDARGPAQAFWTSLAQSRVSPDLRRIAKQMAERL